jgi:hypothetical protein
VAALRATRAAHPWLSRPSAGAAPRPADRLAPRARAAQVFGWIEAAVSEMASAAPVAPGRLAERQAAVVEQLAAVDVSLPLERLSISEHEIHTRGEAFARVLEALDGVSARERAAAIASLPPLPRLIYYASYDALDNGDVAAAGSRAGRSGADLASALDAIADRVPADQQWRAAALLGFIAANLAHLTPAFDRPAKPKARSALGVFRRAVARGARHAEVLDAAMRCAKLAADKRALVAIATQAIDATRDPTVAKQAARLARAMRDTRTAARFDARAKAIAASSKLAQKETDPAKLVAHLDAGGEPTVDLLANLAVRFTAASPRSAIAAHVERMAGVLLGEPSFGMHPGVALNFCVMAGNHGFGERAIDVVDELLSRGLSLDQQLGLSFTYAATVARRAASKRRVLARFVDADPDEVSPLAFSNLAVVHLQLRDKAKALAELVRARDHGHPTFAELRRHADFTTLHGDSQFEGLFAKRRAKREQK